MKKPKMVPITIKIPLEAFVDFQIHIAEHNDGKCKCGMKYTPEHYLEKAVIKTAAFTRAKREYKEEQEGRTQQIVDIIKKITGGALGDGAEVFNPFEDEEIRDRAAAILDSYLKA